MGFSRGRVALAAAVVVVAVAGCGGGADDDGWQDTQPAPGSAVIGEPLTDAPDPDRTADLAGFVSGARAVLGTDGGSDAAVAMVGVMLCEHMPLTPGEMEQIASGRVPGSSVRVSVEEVAAVAALAEAALCPGGVLLPERLPTSGAAGPAVPEPDVAAPEPSPTVLAACPTMKQLKGSVRLVRARPGVKSVDWPSAESSMVVEAKLTNPRPYPVWFIGEVSATAPGEWPISGPYGGFDSVRLEPGQTTVLREELGYIGASPTSVSWKRWVVAGGEMVVDEQACEQITSDD